MQNDQNTYWIPEGSKTFLVELEKIKHATFQVKAENEEEAKKIVLNMVRLRGLGGATKVKDGTEDRIVGVSEL